VRWLRWTSGIVWILSWYTIYLEVFRWHHMTKSLRFNPPPPIPGTSVQPKAGMPLIAVCLSSVVAPLVFITATVVKRAPRLDGASSVPGWHPADRFPAEGLPASRRTAGDGCQQHGGLGGCQAMSSRETAGKQQR
jgi:hypothetical protein